VHSNPLLLRLRRKATRALVFVSFFAILLPVQGLKIPAMIASALCHRFLVVHFPSVFAHGFRMNRSASCFQTNRNIRGDFHRPFAFNRIAQWNRQVYSYQDVSGGLVLSFSLPPHVDPTGLGVRRLRRDGTHLQPEVLCRPRHRLVVPFHMGHKFGRSVTVTSTFFWRVHFLLGNYCTMFFLQRKSGPVRCALLTAREYPSTCRASPAISRAGAP